MRYENSLLRVLNEERVGEPHACSKRGINARRQVKGVQGSAGRSDADLYRCREDCNATNDANGTKHDLM
jgi:hypothetical protein